MLTAILDILKSLPKEWITVIIAALPIFELRGSIPVALAMGLSPVKAFLLSILGNLVPVIPVLLFLEPVSNRLTRFKLWRNFFDWLFERTKAKGDLIQKYEALGLMLFVAVPLPMTGAWSGCIAASLFKIKFRYAFPAIILGVVTAGIIVLSVCLFSKGAWSFLLAK
ncbi:MAG: small multi-drug export protein [Candidatus Omnitrophica bacterium]|nr:small multi-drug export protein [Candidatus Omnitrophota bacterium]